jgi:iron complex outermembrane receptor protein
MFERKPLMLSCALGVLLLSAGAAAAQSAASAQPAASQPTQSTSATTDAAARASQTTQSTQATSAAAVGDVVVTATSRRLSLQHVPVAASAYTDQRRNLVGITTASDIVNFTPSMSLNGEFLSLRGVGRYTDELGTDPGVAVFVDGIYTPSPDYLNQPDFFSDRIEILRGPQGTLGGENDIGGTVNVVEKRPTDDFHEEGRVGFNNYDYWYTDLSVSGPITDNLKFRLADAYADQPTDNGFVKNLDSKIFPGSGSSNLFEGQLDWKPTSNFDAWFKVQNFGSDNAASYGVNPTQYPISTVSYCPTINGAADSCLGPDGASLFLAQTPPVGNPQLSSHPKFPNVVDVNVPGYVKEKNDWTFSTQLTWSLPGMTLEYIGGYSQYDYDYLSDLDGTPSNAFAFPLISAVNTGYQAEKWYQNEIQLKSDTPGPLKWIVGAYQYWNHYDAPYLDEEPNNASLATPVFATGPGAANCATTGPIMGSCPLAAPNPLRTTYSQVAHLTDESEAIYGNVDYDVTDTVRLTGGLRYNWDAKQGSVDYREIFDTAGVFFDPPLYALDVTPAGANESAKIASSDWTGKIGAEWRPDSSTLVYASASKGYKSGGMALLDITPIPVVRPETLYDFEGGIKKTFGSQFLIDADVYYYDYHNLQQFLTVEGANDLFSSELVSAQRARNYGFELESVWSPTPDFQLSFNYSYLNAHFTQFSLPGGPIVDVSQLAPGCIGTGTAGPAGTPGQCNGVAHANLNGNVVPQSPANKVTINPVYTLNSSVGKFTFSGTYAWIDRQYYGVFNNPGFLAPSYYNLDLRLLYQPPQGHITFILFAKNVTDQVQIVNYSTGSFTTGPANLIKGAAAFPSSGQVTYFVNPPRTFGAELQVRF